MEFLEDLDRKHRAEGAGKSLRLRQVPPETGKFLALLAASAPEGAYLEIGTSGGYSALWVALACRQLGRKLVTFEVLKEKALLATKTFKLAEVEDVVELVTGDARKLLQNYTDVSFCFLDAEKEHYNECYDLVVPNMVPGGIIAADNVISHQKILADFVAKVSADNRVAAVTVPIGSGVLLCRKT
jgi:predicted O-methyltransferase YrrM